MIEVCFNLPTHFVECRKFAGWIFVVIKESGKEDNFPDTKTFSVNSIEHFANDD